MLEPALPALCFGLAAGFAFMSDRLVTDIVRLRQAGESRAAASCVAAMAAAGAGLAGAAILSLFVRLF